MVRTMPTSLYVILADLITVKVHHNEALTKLRQLASATTPTNGFNEDVFALYTPDYPSLLYGRWLREYEKAEPAVWRKCFRARILESLNGLDDKDPVNDTAAYTKLAISLFQAGDEKRAGAIVAVLFKALEDYLATRQKNHSTNEVDASRVGEGEEARKKQVPGVSHNHISQTASSMASLPKKDSQTPPTTEADKTTAFTGPTDVQSVPATEEIPGPQIIQSLYLASQLETHPWVYLCKLCECNAMDKGEFWLCKICHNCTLCGQCLEKIKSSSADKRLCNPRHQWYRTWPLQNERVKETASSFGEGGRVELRKEWSEDLRNEWLRG